MSIRVYIYIYIYMYINIYIYIYMHIYTPKVCMRVRTCVGAYAHTASLFFS